jgi:hypothetical protein
MISFVWIFFFGFFHPILFYSHRSVMLFILIFRLCTMFIFSSLTYLLRSKFSVHSNTLVSSTLQIQKYDYSTHLNFIISIIVFVNKPSYTINSYALFANLSFLIFNKLNYVIIFFWSNYVIIMIHVFYKFK